MKKKLTKEHIKKISKAKIGKKRCKKFCKKNSINNQGSKNTFAVLIEESVLEIREMKENDGYTYLELAEFFDVSKETIGKICRRETWKHI